MLDIETGDRLNQLGSIVVQTPLFIVGILNIFLP